MGSGWSVIDTQKRIRSAQCFTSRMGKGLSFGTGSKRGTSPAIGAGTKRKSGELDGQRAIKARKLTESDHGKTTTTAQPFRFMNLPRDIRLMVYERIPVVTKMYEMLNYREVPNVSHNPQSPAGQQGYLRLLDATLSTSILRVSHSMHHEAAPIMEAKLHELRAQPPKLAARFFICDGNWASDLVPHMWEIVNILHWLTTMHTQYKDFSCVPGREGSEEFYENLQKYFQPQDEEYVRGVVNRLFRRAFVRRFSEHIRYRRHLAQQDGNLPLPTTMDVAIVGNKEEILGIRSPAILSSLPQPTLLAIPQARHNYFQIMLGCRPKPQPLIVVRVARPSFFNISAGEETAFEQAMNNHSRMYRSPHDGKLFRGVVVGDAVDEEEYMGEWCAGEHWSEHAAVKAGPKVYNDRANAADAKAVL